MTASYHHQTVANLIESDLIIGDQISFLVTSNSMQPILKNGDTVIADITHSKDIHCGDIVVIRRESDFLTHRAISKNNSGWLTKGDNNTLFDPPVMPANIVGRVRIVQKANKTIYLEKIKWRFFNPLLAKLGTLEIKAFSYHRKLRLPFRAMIIGIQIWLIL